MGALPSVVDCDLGWTLGTVFRAYVKIADEVFTELPGGARGYQVLSAAVGDQPLPIGALAERLGIDKSVMTYVVDALEEHRLVERRPYAGDRRTKQVVRTPDGDAAWAGVQNRLRRGEDHVLSVLEPAERETFRELLQRLAAHAHAHDPVHDACRLVEDLA